MTESPMHSAGERYDWERYEFDERACNVDQRVNAQREQRSLKRVCPCYRLPQLAPGTALAGRARLPVCTALDEIAHIDHEKAARLCRSGAFPTCDRFIVAYPNWRPATPDANPVNSSSARIDPVFRQLLSSAAWVIGIPTAITLFIMLAIWITENVWMPTQTFYPAFPS